MDVVEFEKLVKPVVDAIGDKAIDAALATFLEQEFPPDGPVFRAIEAACHVAIAEGWMCNREQGGIKFGRITKPGGALGKFSIDVVQMADVKGPHHRHPRGEIDMVMPITEGAEFDGHSRGWCVYGPDSAHHPTVSGGEALVLYLLPDSAIEFTGK